MPYVVHAAAPPIDAHRLVKRFVAGAQRCRAEVLALRSASLIVSSGEVVVLVGSAGAGKSTLLQCAAGLLKPEAGTLRWSGALAPEIVRTRYVRGVRDAMEAHRCLAALGGGLLLFDVLVESLNGEERRVAERLAREAPGVGTAIVMCARRAASLRGLRCRALFIERGITREAPDDERRERSTADRVAEPRP